MHICDSNVLHTVVHTCVDCFTQFPMSIVPLEEPVTSPCPVLVAEQA